MPPANRPRISIIIPTLNEAERLPLLLDSLRGLEGGEVIVADGGSRDQTLELARRAGARLVECFPGKARQMNRAVVDAQGEILLFLHADTLLPEDFLEQVLEILDQPGVVAGAFRLGIDGPGRMLRWVEKIANYRSRVLQLPYGDQAIFMRRDLFLEAGGFPHQPIMEDFELMRRLRRRGRIALAASAVLTSDRRWRRLGVVRTTLINQVVILAYRLGVSPDRLERWYGRISRS